MRIIAVGNQKGGVGKTTTAVNLAAWLAEQAHRVLLVDLDSQGHVAASLGVPGDGGLYQLLVMGLPLDQVAYRARVGLHIIRNDHTGERVKAHAMQSDFRAYMLIKALGQAGGRFDNIILDMPPSTDVLHISALVASNWLLVPAVMDHLALRGVMDIINTARSIDGYPGVKVPELLGILPTMYERVTVETTENLVRLGETLGGADIILPPIPKDTKVREASAYGQTIWEYAPESPAAVGYDRKSTITNSTGRVGGYLHLAEILERIVKWQ